MQLPDRYAVHLSIVVRRSNHNMWSFSFRVYCCDRKARLTSECYNKYLHYWQPVNPHKQHSLNEGPTSWMRTLLILNAYPRAWMHALLFENIPYRLNAYPAAWIPTLKWSPNLGLSFRCFCTMQMVNLLLDGLQMLGQLNKSALYTLKPQLAFRQ